MNKKLLAAAVASALAMPMAAHAVKYSASGQVNRAIQIADDGQRSDITNVDGSASSTRFRFRGSEDIGNGLTAGFLLEFDAASDPDPTMKGAPTGFGGTADSGDFAGLGDRHSAVYFSGDFGKLTMGHTSVATDGVAYADLDGTWLSGIENTVDFGGAIEFVTSTGGTGIDVANVMDDFDGGRTSTLRYDSPSLGPVSFAVSASDNDLYDGMVIVSGPVAGGQYDLRGGMSKNDTRENLVLSGGFKAAQGTSINLTWGSQDQDAAGSAEGEYFYVKLGHAWGNSSVAVDYRSSEETHQAGICTGSNSACGVEAWGVGFVHTLPKPGVDLYASYRLYTLEDGPSGVDDVGIFVVGSRVRFD